MKKRQSGIKIHTHIIIAVLSYVIVQSSFAQELSQTEWSLAKEDDGINVYTRKIDGYQIKQTMVETIVDVPIDQLYEVLIDFDHHDDWMVNFSNSKLLISIDSATHIYYIEVDAPWPVMDRDLVIKGSLEYKSDSLVILNTNKIEGYKEIRDKFIRVPMMNGQWRLEKINERTTKVTNTTHGDPGGSLPGWIVNIKLVNDPISSIKNFVAIAKTLRK